jgi:hypothetical protein
MFLATPEPNSSSISWLPELTFNESIAFCIWILQIDGLRVTPFDNHPEGDSSLQALGLDANNWQTWLNQVVTAHDPRLSWLSADIQEVLEERMSSFEAHLDQSSLQISEEEKSSFRLSSERSLVWQNQQYHKAVSVLGKTPKGETSPSIWSGNLQIKERLEELWRNYQLLIPENFCQVIHDIMEYSDFGSSLSPFQSQLDFLKIYLVPYAKTVEYAVPPVTLILSTPDTFNREDFEERLVQAVQSLCSLN